jgi:hypothetical protein
VVAAVAPLLKLWMLPTSSCLYMPSVRGKFVALATAFLLFRLDVPLELLLRFPWSALGTKAFDFLAWYIFAPNAAKLASVRSFVPITSSVPHTLQTSSPTLPSPKSVALHVLHMRVLMGW